MTEVIAPDRSTVVVARGPRAAEAELLRLVDAARPRAVGELERPLRIVVPSKSLRGHVARRLTLELGSLVGVEVQTLYGLALEVLSRADPVRVGGEAAVRLLTRRLAREERLLRGPLDRMADGYDSAVGAVRDLLDAGYGPAHLDPVLEKLADLTDRVADDRLARAGAVARLAARVVIAAEENGILLASHVPQLAEHLILTGGQGPPPTSGLIVHGFADVTGVTADLLRAMLRTTDGWVLLDRPDDPSDPARPDAGHAFLDRLERRLADLDVRCSAPPPDPATMVLCEAADCETEARWVADRVRFELERGLAPEDIGVVARSFETVGSALRRQLGRLGVPFSGVGSVKPGGKVWRVAQRLGPLLQLGPEAEVDSWVEASAMAGGTVDLLAGLRVLGVLRLADAAQLGRSGAVQGDVRLPIAFPVDDVDQGEVRPKFLATAALTAAGRRAAEVMAAFDRWPNATTADGHSRSAMSLVESLGWTREGDEWTGVARAFDSIAAELPPELEIEQDEWLSLACDRLAKVGEVAVGGSGGGVQILTVMEARGRTFESLFLVGVTRGIFPRVILEDPLLPEMLRVRLASDVLSEMPVKARGADEDRYLFAQLLAAAPSVFVSWHLAAGTSVTAPSPFVDRLPSDCERVTRVSAPGLWRPPSTAGDDYRPRSGHEHAVLAGLHSSADIAPYLEIAMTEGIGVERDSAWVDVAATARARGDVLRAADAKIEDMSVGPWHGFVGTGVVGGDAIPWVTRYEGVALCPWRAFVSSRLGVAPMADPRLGLPQLDHRKVGAVVHEVLERIVLEAGGGRGEDLDVVGDRAAVDVPWPAERRVGELLREVASRVARDGGVAMLGLGKLLAARARPHLEIARDVEWGADRVLRGVVAAEVNGEVRVGDTQTRVAFRADRLDLGPVLVDYKTSRPLSEAKTESKRVEKTVEKVAAGRALQAAAYAAAAGDHGEGRYLFLAYGGAELSDEVRRIGISGADESVAELFETAVRTIESAVEAGVAFPRVEDSRGGDMPDHCKYCLVAEACRRDDTGFRRRLVTWMEHQRTTGDAPQRAARELWWLGVRPAESDR